jgi:hypothetical protein
MLVRQVADAKLAQFAVLPALVPDVTRSVRGQADSSACGSGQRVIANRRSEMMKNHPVPARQQP